MNQTIEPCYYPNCGGWYKSLVDSYGHIDKICVKCGRSDDQKHEKRVENGIKKHIEFDILFKKIMRQKAAKIRRHKKEEMEEIK